MGNETNDLYQVNLSDFALFLPVMKNKKAYRNVLSIILNEPEVQMEQVKVEEVILKKLQRCWRNSRSGLMPYVLLQQNTRRSMI